MSTATDMLAAYLAAEAQVLLGKEARVDGRLFRAEDLDKIREGRKEWEVRVRQEQGIAAGVPTIGGLSFARARLDGC
jgi:hypothetical protein